MCVCTFNFSKIPAQYNHTLNKQAKTQRVSPGWWRGKNGYRAASAGPQWVARASAAMSISCICGLRALIMMPRAAHSHSTYTILMPNPAAQQLMWREKQVPKTCYCSPVSAFQASVNNCWMSKSMVQAPQGPADSLDTHLVSTCLRFLVFWRQGSPW